MKLIVGLGNPGELYKNTRHNVGFMFLDKIVDDLNLKFTVDKRLKGEIAISNFNSEKVILLKPLTFMNLSGEAVKLVKDYYKIDDKDILVIYDDLDLPTGKIRIRQNGSAGGHKGMGNIIKLLGNDLIKRVRIGIDKSERIPVVDYVLGRFLGDEDITIRITLDKAYDMYISYLSTSFENFMNKYN